jgi:SAM-dependent methyltransferase
MARQIHQSDPVVLSRRALKRDNRHLAALLRPGMSVLDVGCGTGAISAGIAARVAPDGLVIGADKDGSLLALARSTHAQSPNLSFEQCDILSLPFDARFDVVSAARTVQWVSAPAEAIVQLRNSARPGGLVAVLDYNHAENKWEPDPPAAFTLFYDAFLAWREANRWDNRIASRLPDLFASAGLEACELLNSSEVTERGDEDFAPAASIWLSVIDKLSLQMFAEGHLAEPAIDAARDSYVSFIATGLERQTLSLRTAIARR